MFHAPAVHNASAAASTSGSSTNTIAAGEQGYISSDGHAFGCNNPVSLHPAYHVCVMLLSRAHRVQTSLHSIFVIDKSGSMSSRDRSPLPGTPVSGEIARVSNNRLGAVCSALHAFWSARQATAQRGSTTVRRDAYSVLMFDTSVAQGVVNDVSSSSDELLHMMLRYRASGGTDFTQALDSARILLEQNWSTDRSVGSFINDYGPDTL